VCPVDCIHPAKNRDYHDGPENQGTKNFDEVPHLYIHPEECIDCGACVPVCPVTAIFPLEDLPEKWANYTQINADYFKPAAG
jgi:ferredoxin